ncbi:glutathione S-transferase kappa 1 isoform X1 [Gopherus flavomarginatus]|uniref:glutathione S-transferase kappa 1 isoform X1 n=1 Tax=Gopherus flavomarginatus TaxID=286002 RepID=UPI0021CBB040|nr:glutathione S-transferase kappa 1 isoform X1 [Gopherus flavomarginatus]
MAAAGGRKTLVEIFYDVVSPYSWLGFEVLCRYRHNWSIELRFRPAFLGGIIKETGNQPPAMVPKRGEYMMKDIKRMAKYYQVPLQIPKDFFGSVIRKGSLSAMRFITAVDMTQPQFLEPVSRELWMRIWSRDEDITQTESILAAAGEAGLPSALAQKLLAMTSTPEVKNRLKETTEEALKYGAFGMPAVVAHVNGEAHLFFGSDRLELLGNVIAQDATQTPQAWSEGQRFTFPHPATAGYRERKAEREDTEGKLNPQGQGWGTYQEWTLKCCLPKKRGP